MSARAALIAACTSRAAPSMLRDRSNCSVMRELPTVLVEVISVTPAIAPSRLSSGVVTLVPTVSGEAPGSDAWTWMVGKSTLGKGDTDSAMKPIMPASRTPAVSSVVATGRAMKIAERFTAGSSRLIALWQFRGLRPVTVGQWIGWCVERRTAYPPGNPVEGEIDHRSREERQHLAHNQAAHDG